LVGVLTDTGEVVRVLKEHSIKDVKVFADFSTTPSFEVLIAVELRFSSYGPASTEEDIAPLELRGTVKKAWLVATASEVGVRLTRGCKLPTIDSPEEFLADSSFLSSI
jgi:hypothetical protein